MSACRPRRLIGSWTELDPVALRQLVQDVRRGRGAKTREIAEPGFQARRRRHPGDLKRSRAGIAHARPRAAGHVQHRPGNDVEDPLIQGHTPLALGDEQHHIPVKMPVNGHVGAG
ncbi:MAG: hypothetical protein A2Z92_03660 [Omnitrophica WOR_2 bacterium GWA2_63_20]|nr:MAG: hypothetical protein A2Z92_03660 [Omnitrophica WOR_2 bacterium GWA2_63_20]